MNESNRKPCDYITTNVKSQNCKLKFGPIFEKEKRGYPICWLFDSVMALPPTDPDPGPCPRTLLSSLQCIFTGVLDSSWGLGVDAACVESSSSSSSSSSSPGGYVGRVMDTLRPEPEDDEDTAVEPSPPPPPRLPPPRTSRPITRNRDRVIC